MRWAPWSRRRAVDAAGRPRTGPARVWTYAAFAGAFVCLLCARPFAQDRSGTAATAPRTNIPYSDALPILESLRDDLLPSDLKSGTPGGREADWSRWVTGRDQEIRERIAEGDEDSVVNFLLFGSSFTRQPRASRDISTLGSETRATAIFQRRVDDLVAGIAAPGANERLQFARLVVERKGIDPGTAAGKEKARAYLIELIKRQAAEFDSYEQRMELALQAKDPSAGSTAQATLFQDRGLASDTSLYADFAIDQALTAVKAKKILAPGSVRRVAIVGPGLDFSDKENGYDFYPPQTIQLFAVIDSLVRLGLATADELSLTTFDLSPRINQHLDRARARARSGDAYVVQVPRDPVDRWTPDLVRYWERFGETIADRATVAAGPAEFPDVQVRVVPVRPALVTRTVSRDLNIVLQRLELAAGERFDLIIATNILIYYDVFEQSLAVANVAHMLRPGGLFLSNGSVGLPTGSMTFAGATDVVFTPVPTGTRVVWHQRH